MKLIFINDQTIDKIVIHTSQLSNNWKLSRQVRFKFWTRLLDTMQDVIINKNEFKRLHFNIDDDIKFQSFTTQFVIQWQV